MSELGISSLGATALQRATNHLQTVAYQAAQASLHGYKGQVALHQLPNDGDRPFAQFMNRHIDRSQGPLKSTNHQAHVAISGQKGFFMVQSPNGMLITRKGNFMRNPATGDLITQEGYQVMGEGGPINIPPEVQDFRINEDGSIFYKDQGLGKVGIFDISQEDLNNARPVSGAYFMIINPGVLTPMESEYTVMQGFLEESNVSIIQETANLGNLTQQVMMQKEALEQYYSMKNSAIEKITRLS